MSCENSNKINRFGYTWLLLNVLTIDRAVVVVVVAGVVVVVVVAKVRQSKKGIKKVICDIKIKYKRIKVR